MQDIVKHIDDIPENIYIQIPLLIYKSWQKQFMEMSKYADRIRDKKLLIPEEGMSIQPRTKYYIKKLESDPLELTYVIFFRIKLDSFVSLLDNFMMKNNINFEFNIFYDKLKLLNYVNKELSKMFKRKFYIEIDIPYVVMHLETTLKTKRDIIYLN